MGDPGTLLGLDPAGVEATGVDAGLAARVVARLDAAAAVAFALDELEQSGLRVLASVDAGYPPALVERLGPRAPPLLHVAGDPSLLGRAQVVSADAADGVATDGPAVVVVAGSLRRVVARPEVRRAITSGRLCVCSPYAPSVRETELTRRGRDTVIQALSAAP